MRFLIDTNTISEPCKREPNPQVLSRLVAHQGALAIAATTWHELRYGVATMPLGRRRDFTQQYVRELGEVMEVLPYDQAAADWHAAERARLKDQLPCYDDGLIAAVAATNDLTLVTRNVRDFERFAGLTVINWFD